MAGGAPTVANTQQIQVFGLFGNDRLTLDEATGALPRANLFGGSGDDAVTGGSGSDFLFGQAGVDTVLGKGGNDVLFGGTEADTLTGGDADDQMFGEAGDDQLIWNPGDDTDLAEGGPDADTVQVNGGNGTETFTATANGVRVRFDRVTPVPFALDIGTTEKVRLDANAGDDRFDVVGSLGTKVDVAGGPGADVVHTGNGADFVDGGDGNDDIRTGDGADLVFGGNGDDIVAGQSGNDVALLGSGADTFRWDPGDGSDTVEGQQDADELVVGGDDTNEQIAVSADASRTRIARADAVLAVNDVEAVGVNAAAGADEVTVDDLTGTDVTDVAVDLGRTDARPPDGAPDTVRVAGRPVADSVQVSGGVAQRQITGLVPTLTVTRSDGMPTDRITVALGAGDDVVVVSALEAPAGIVLDGDAGDDVLVGSKGDDLLLGGAGDDVLVGGPGTDTLNGGPGNNILLGGEVVTDGQIPTKAWLAAHARTGSDGSAVLDVGGRQIAVPGVTVEALHQDAAA